MRDWQGHQSSWAERCLQAGHGIAPPGMVGSASSLFARGRYIYVKGNRYETENI